MKKFTFMFVAAFAAMTIASCGGAGTTTQATDDVDSTAVDSTLVVDEVVADTLAVDTVVAE